MFGLDVTVYQPQGTLDISEYEPTFALAFRHLLDHCSIPCSNLITGSNAVNYTYILTAHRMDRRSFKTSQSNSFRAHIIPLITDGSSVSCSNQLCQPTRFRPSGSQSCASGCGIRFWNMYLGYLCITIFQRVLLSRSLSNALFVSSNFRCLS